ncbi:MAG: pilus assembly protein TadG-related protein [Acidimicrobiia bacterium]|nr:pilus assembly protein TadG-related protein [Acidimicrobiia bacterium]
MIGGNEHGVSGILVAGSLMLLIGLAAVAVDLGAAYNERRGDQTAVDIGALAGAQSIINGTDAMVTDSLSYIRQNLATTYTNTEWQTAWQGCTDPGRPAGYVQLRKPSAWGGGTLPCMSFHPSGLFRVKIPDQIVDTSFGRALGVNSIATRAEATVRVRNRGIGGILPFGMLGTASCGDQI